MPLTAATVLKNLGYTRIESIQGGIRARIATEMELTTHPL
jgi:hypothetical protein